MNGYSPDVRVICQSHDYIPLLYYKLSITNLHDRIQENVKHWSAWESLQEPVLNAIRVWLDEIINNQLTWRSAVGQQMITMGM